MTMYELHLYIRSEMIQQIVEYIAQIVWSFSLEFWHARDHDYIYDQDAMIIQECC